MTCHTRGGLTQPAHALPQPRKVKLAAHIGMMDLEEVI